MISVMRASLGQAALLAAQIALGVLTFLVLFGNILASLLGFGPPVE